MWKYLRLFLVFLSCFFCFGLINVNADSWFPDGYLTTIGGTRIDNNPYVNIPSAGRSVLISSGLFGPINWSPSNTGYYWVILTAVGTRDDIVATRTYGDGVACLDNCFSQIVGSYLVDVILENNSWVYSYYFVFQIKKFGYNGAYDMEWVDDYIKFSTSSSSSAELYPKSFFSVNSDPTSTLKQTDIQRRQYLATQGITGDINELSSDITNKLESITGTLHDAQDYYGILNHNDSVNTQGKIDDVNESINDSTIDTTKASSFFSNFNDVDHGGISGLITSPLRFVRDIGNSCTPMTFTLFDSDIEVPCGDTLVWNKSGFASFRVIWNTLIGGSVIYMVLRKVFKTIEDMKDPDNDKVSVMSL